MYKFLIFFIFLISSCKEDAMNNEFLDKQEYSILQSFEFNYRLKNNAEKYIINLNALNSGFDVIALPIAGKSEGYVVMLAKSKNGTQIKILPNVNFDLNHDTFKTLKAKVTLSPAVNDYLTSQIR